MIPPDELARAMAANASLAVFDLRERAAYERGHIFRATSLPRRLLEFRLAQLVTARATAIVLCDDDGRLGALARVTLAELGYSNVDILADGLAAWRAAGRPLVQGVNVPSKVFGERVLHEQATPEISPRELQTRVERGDDMVIVDARTPDEYTRGCIPGAWNVPGGELVLRIADLVRDQDTTIVVHCGGRTRSYIGAESLRRMGLANPIVALRNGTMGWELAGLELERGATRWAPAPSDRARAVAGAVAARVAAEDGIAFLSPPAVQSLWERRDRENVSILDVRSADEYARGHIAGSIFAPGGQAVQATDEYVAVSSGHVICVCDDGARSVMTAGWLRRLGLPNVRVLAGGVTAWAEAGGALEGGHEPSLPAGYEAARAAATAVAPAALDKELRDPRPPVVINVDPSDVYARGHVPGATWLCRSRLELRIGDVVPDLKRPVVVTCTDGLASTFATATLSRCARDAVRVLEGGTRAWEAAGFPVERGLTRLGDEADDVLRKPYERGRAAMEAYLRWEIDLDHQGRSGHVLLPETTDTRPGSERPPGVPHAEGRPPIPGVSATAGPEPP
jgi:rhodanese-related sulfurtransferase